MEQFEQLLTCCVCLDRYRIPKLLPCQHSFCMEPCMEGLVDYVRRQVKCPECRAEHRIPYNGVQAFPTNVTLQRFLELHIEITGELPDPTSGQIMERCGVCSEKSYLNPCAHCEKKICDDCKSAHMDILRREITRFNSQIRRSLHRLQDSLALIEKNMVCLQTNCASTTEEIDEIYLRITKAIKDRADQLKQEIDRYLTIELRNLKTLKENLDGEISNINSNCDIVDKYMNETVEWDDCELMDTKEIFLKTVEFLRHFEYENSDYSRRVRFMVSIDPNQLVLNLATFGDLNIAPHSNAGGMSGSSHLAPPSSLQPGLMRSKSDHRLATQFRQQEERIGYNDEPVLGGRKFGERPVRVNNERDRYGDSGSSRYGRSGAGGDYDYGENDYDDSSSRTGKSRFRSRFVRSHQNDDSDNEEKQQQRLEEKKLKDKVRDGEDASRGQLSGIIRLSDCARVIQRLADIGKEKKEKKVDASAQAAIQAAIQAQKASMQRPKQNPPATQRQVSEDDEINHIKRQNKNAPSSSTAASAAATATATETERPTVDRVSALKRNSVVASSGNSDDSDHAPNSSSPVNRTPPRSESKPAAPVPAQVAAVKKTTRSGSSDSTASTESSASSAAAGRAPSAARFSVSRESPARTSRPTAGTSATTTASTAATTGTTTTEKKPFVSRFLPQHTTAPAEKSKVESDSSSEEETSTEESEDEEVDVKKPSASSASKPTSSAATSGYSAGSSTTSSYRDRLDSRRSSRDDTASKNSSAYATPSSSSTATSSGYGGSTSAAARARDTDTDRYGSGASGSSYTSRFLNKSKSSAIVSQPSLSTPNASFDEDANGTGDDSDSRYGTGRSRYLAMKERRNRLARSRSSHQFGNDDDDVDEPVSPTTASPSAYLASRYSGYGGTDLSRSRSSHALKSRDSSPVNERTSSRSGAGASTSNADNKDGEALSSWARYLKNKYGSKSSKDTPSSSGRDNLGSSSTSTALPSSSHGASGSSRSHAASDVSRRLSLGLPLRQVSELGSSDDDASKNGLGSPTSPMVAAAAHGMAGVAGTSPKQLYLRKRQQLFQLGGRGSEPGSFTWPRGLAVGPDNSIVVADSSNHRVQVFDSNGIFVKQFGEYGNGEGEFDCLAGVAVNRIGQYIIADRYNHRIQVLDPQGRFLRAFGSQGTADGKFNYPWGVTTDALGFIYVCDKENHRVQVFQSDGSFVGKFGTCGRGEGQLEHPHYIAVSNTNRVIVSDSNNHRIQIFDVNGKVLSTFGGEGSDDGQFKFPRGVAVDDQGYIFVADSGNNRIQIFNPDGSFLKTFGSWGSGDSEFKGLEGVAIMSNGNILVCDRENHRVQVF
ncbi:RING finger protein nhl-1 isoform X2 [Stomoxys calcitrans]|uniref:RING-type domain-containing protein n=1 Tax=Stomoxys calcitrans TaxID=35570 RepID=A0A1I8PQM8_STOCA|nr:RING finger protein nhl-1 isoform X2 [Stomoxys calcitrans]